MKSSWSNTSISSENEDSSSLIDEKVYSYSLSIFECIEFSFLFLFSPEKFFFDPTRDRRLLLFKSSTSSTMLKVEFLSCSLFKVAWLRSFFIFLMFRPGDYSSKDVSLPKIGSSSRSESPSPKIADLESCKFKPDLRLLSDL